MPVHPSHAPSVVGEEGDDGGDPAPQMQLHNISSCVLRQPSPAMKDRCSAKILNPSRKSFMDSMRTTIAEVSAEARANTANTTPAWGDTPDSADMEKITHIEREALRSRFHALGPSEVVLSPAMPRQLAFVSTTPTVVVDTNTNVLQPTVQRAAPVQHRNSGRRPSRPPSKLGIRRSGTDLDASTAKRVKSVGVDLHLHGVMGTPSAGSPPATHLEAYLPVQICESLRSAGAPGVLYAWQAECLCRPGVLQGRSLVYCAPTSGGKSLVAEVLMLRRLLSTGRPCLLVLPYIALCHEKSSHLRRWLDPIGREVLEYYGNSCAPLAASLGSETGVIVCTIEKANMLINRLLEEQSVSILSCVCIDELHMVGDEDRGYQLELLLTKLRYAASPAFSFGTSSQSVPMFHSSDIQTCQAFGVQVVGMSATLPNVEAVALWLDAELYKTTFRPVPLRIFLKEKVNIEDESGHVVRQLTPASAEWEARDPDHVALLTKETVDDGHSVLVFCATRKSCSTTAASIAALVDVPERHLPWRPNPSSKIEALLSSEDPPDREAFCSILRRNEAEHPDLLDAISHGVAFHHAALDSEEREIVEAAFRCGAVSVLCATSTLAAGVNLPARRVIFKHPYVYANGKTTTLLDATKFRQMAGRAGRAGLDSVAEAFLLAVRDAPAPRLRKLLSSDPEPIESCLREDRRGMKRAMIEVVASGAVRQPADVERYIRCTLLAATISYDVVVQTTKEALQWLGHRDQGFIFWDSTTGTYQPSPLGRAAVASGLPPELCMQIRSDLALARDGFVLTSDLHLAFLCIPATEELQPDWRRLLAMTGFFKPYEASVAEKVGLNMKYIKDQAHGMVAAASSSHKEQERICRRFWTALILADVLQETEINELRCKYGIQRATTENLQESISRYAGMLAAFCERLGWHDLEMLIAKFQARTMTGARPEILPLVEIRYVQTYTARLLYRAGIKTPEALAALGDVDRVAHILAAGRRGGGKTGAEQRIYQRQARNILNSARDLLAQKAKRLRAEASAALLIVQQGFEGQRVGNNEAIDTISDEPQRIHGSSKNDQVAAIPHHVDNQPLPAPPSQGGCQAKFEGARQVDGGVCNPSGTTRALEKEQAAGGASSIPKHPKSSSTTMTSIEEEPDAWECGRATGIVTLSSFDVVNAMCDFLESQQRHPRFGFMFDVVTPQGPGTLNTALTDVRVPAGPSAARLGEASCRSRGVRDAALPTHQPSNALSLEVVGVALSWRAGQAFYVPLQRKTQPEIWHLIAKLFSNPRLEKVTFDLKTQMAALSLDFNQTVTKVDVHPPFVDVRISAFLLSPDDQKLSDSKTGGLMGHSGFGSSATGRRSALAHYTPESLADVWLGPLVVATATSGMQLHNSAPPTLIQRIKACRAAAVMNIAQTQLITALEVDGTAMALANVEMPIVPLLVEMESRGIGLDASALEAEIPAIVRRLGELEQLAAQSVGEPVNLSVPAECSRALHEVLRIPPPPSAAHRGDHTWSTCAEALEEMSLLHPECALPGLISEHRSLSKLLGWCHALLPSQREAVVAAVKPTRVRGRFNQTVAVTGRLTMDEPNLQAAPRPMQFSVSTTPPSNNDNSKDKGIHEGFLERRLQTCNLRRAFVAPLGKVLVSADYRQLELRLIAHFSGDPTLLCVLKDDSVVEPFTALAAAWLGVSSAAQVTSEQRNKAKKLAYGLLYGMGTASLARELGLCGPGAETRASTVAHDFLNSLPGVQTWMDAIRTAACAPGGGEVRTVAGRVRRFDSSFTSDFERARVERQAINAVVQGSAADIAKMGMIAVHQEVGNGVARLVLQIHDELLFEVDEGRVHAANAAIVSAMEGVMHLKVPLRVRVMAGSSWGDLRDIE